ncbi:MAG TPA: 23S rRNA (guanosine(2251)-2'-O)-methyltransferase RlmB [Trebonia sp.]|jgi:23S rRNA (guanosine2251-2'-O)-methyltransferase
MSGQKKGGSDDGRTPGGGGFSKRGKPRPGTGGNRRDKLEGKKPTPPAHMRPGHPAQRAAAKAARSTGRPGQPAPRGSERGGDSRGRSEPRYESSGVRGGGDGPEMVAGRNSVVESLRAGIPAIALYFTSRAHEDERVAEAVQLAADAGIAVLESGMPELDRLTGDAIHQGVALRVRPYEYAHPEELSERRGPALPLIVALDGVTDPRNLGAVVRSAAAFGATGVVVPARRSAGVTAGAWKASAGALVRMPVAQAVNLTRALENYKKAGFFVAGLDAAGTTSVRDMSIADGPMVLVVGSEGRGLSRVVAGACDMLVSIPMASGNESLNAGIAASVALYEIAGIRARKG